MLLIGASSCFECGHPVPALPADVEGGAGAEVRPGAIGGMGQAARQAE
jgi:hypothetical protein